MARGWTTRERPPVRAIVVAALVVVLVAACAVSGASPSAMAPAPTPAAPGTSASPTGSITPVSAATQKLIDRERRLADAPGMLALVAHGDAVTWATSGTADTAGTAITRTTRFRIASITKPIVAALVLDAVDRGLLTLDDDVAALLPGVIRPTPPTTVRQLLDHTAGVFDEGNEGDPTKDADRIADPALRKEALALLPRVAADPTIVVPDRIIVALADTHDRYFDPGTDYHYSNVGYQLAAMLLERRTGSSLADLLRSRIVEPLGRERTSVAPANGSTPELRGYDATITPGTLVDVSDQLFWFGNGANGGIVSTAEELLAMLRAIVDGTLLPASLVTAMETPTFGTYGLGLGRYDLSCGTFYGHEGAVLGTRSIAMVSGDGTDGVVIALNSFSDRDPALQPLADRLLCPAG